jgi:hypothetical protein
MNPFRDPLLQWLESATERLREARLPGELATALTRLAGQLDQPCVVAVVGRMKVGKSTFINALLGEDLARVGATETTATINRFRHGQPDPAGPVRCHWRGGQVTEEDRAFLDSLQGNDVETLRRAEGIDYLEYQLLNPFLEQVTLVDTPGTAALVDEHEERTAEFLAVRKRLRERHSEDTQRLGREADAVVYLVGQVPRLTDQAFLDEFANATGGTARALNAVGVLARIDLQPEILEQREQLARRIARQLQGSLNTVVPVSAGIQRALDGLLADQGKRLLELMAAVRSLSAPLLDKLLASEDLYRELEPAGCPVSCEQRERLLGAMPWAVFTTIARVAAEPGLSEAAVAERLADLAGFGPLREVLHRHFLQRGQFLRCYRIAGDARKVLNTVRYQHLPSLRNRDRDEEAQRDRFLGFLSQAGGDRTVARELEEFVSRQCGVARRGERVETILRELERPLAQLFRDLEEHNHDFEALLLLHDHAARFSAAELDELRALLGLYGLSPAQRLRSPSPAVEVVEQRQEAWRQVSLRDRSAERAAVADRAVVRYGLLLQEMTEGE